MKNKKGWQKKTSRITSYLTVDTQLIFLQYPVSYGYERSNQVLHLSTNVGYKINPIQVMDPDYGKVWYCDKEIANIFLLTNLVKKYGVNYNSYQDHYFSVHNNGGFIKFRRKKKDIYVFNPTYSIAKYNVVTTVEENMVGLPSRKI